MEHRMPSKFFKIGVLAERNKSTGLNEDEFCSLALSMSPPEGENSNTVNKFAHTSASFLYTENKIAYRAGMLFERFATKPDLPRVNRRGMCSLLKYIFRQSASKSSEELDIETVFYLGELYHEFAKSSPLQGLSELEFETLVMKSELCQLLLSTPSILDTTEPNDTDTSIPRELQIPQARGPQNPIRKKTDDSASRLQKVELGLKQIVAEIKAEERLYRELPEAFNAANLQLLGHHYHQLLKQRSVLLSESKQ